MSVPASERGYNKFEVFLKSRELCEYTIHICSNSNNFDTKYKEYLTDDLVKYAKEIHIKLWTANNIYVNASKSENNKLAYAERIRLQNEAIVDCTMFLAMLEVARKVFRIQTRRFEHWGKLILSVKELAKAWKDSDMKRMKAL